MTSWTNVPKPTNLNWIGVAKPSESSVFSFSGGDPIGLLLALTYTRIVPSVLTGWTDIQKPTTQNWTSVSKPTS